MIRRFHPHSRTSLVQLLVFSISTVFVALMFAGMGLFKDPVKWFIQLKNSIDLDASLICFLPLAFLFLPAALWFIQVKDAYLEIGPTSFTLFFGNSWLTRRLKGHAQGAVEYSSIVRAIYNKSTNRIRISSRTHAVKEIPLGAFQEKDEILSLLSGYLGEKLIVEHENKLTRAVTKVELITIGLYVFTLLIEPIKNGVAWESVLYDSIFTPIRLKSFSLGEDGQSVWIVDDKLLSKTRKIWEVKSGSIQVWRGLKSDYHDVQVSHSADGSPVVIKENELFLLENGVWKSQSLAGNEFHSSWRDRPTVHGTEFWGRNSFGETWGINFSTGDIVKLQHPSLTKASFYGFQVNADGSLLVEIDDVDGIYLYVYDDGKWIEPGYFLDDKSWALDPTDYCLDSEATPWVLREREDGFYVGYFSSEKANWEWISLNPYSIKGEEYSALQVDKRGRLWLQGDIDFDDFVRVYEVLPGGLYEVVEYNEYNSNFQSDFLITLGPDGKIWSGGDTLTWIDSNAPDLPRPLPKWIAAFGTFPLKITIQSLFILAMLFVAFTKAKYDR